MPLEFTFEAPIWLYQGQAAWTFVSLPVRIATQIHKADVGPRKPGASIRVTAILGHTTWKTSLFRDSRRNTYVLPLKAAVRKKEQLREGEAVEVTLLIETRDP